MGFLRTRASEPANIGALRNVNRTFTFLHEVTGTEQANRLTATPLYDAVYREILTSCEPGRPVKQAPRFPVGLLALVENLVTTNSNPAYMRMYGWWHDAFLRPPWLVSSRHHSQRWESDRALEGGRRGTYKNVSARPVRVDASSFISSPQWLSAGWQILNELAPFQRDHLLPAPAGAYDSCLRMELRYVLGYAIQNRLLASLVDSKGAKVLTAEATVFWTPHSGRSFLLSCTAALGFPREERDYFGGWSPQASDTHARTAKPGISSIQRSVFGCDRAGPRRRQARRAGKHDPAGKTPETERTRHSHGCEDHERRLVSGVSAKELEKMQYLHRTTWKKKNEGNRGLGAEENRGLGSPRELTAEENRGRFPSGSERPELDPEVDILERPDKRQNAEKIKKLGGTPKQRREQIRATLLPGYYVCESGKTRMRILHQLGSCWMVPGVDYFSFAHHGDVRGREGHSPST